MTNARLTLADADATLELGSRLAAVAEPGLVLTLEGALGAGKTTLAKGLISSLTGLDHDDVLSPTFNLLLEYDEGAFPVYHLDCYRLGCGDQLVDLGFYDWLDQGSTLIVIEWPERVADALPEARLAITLEHRPEGRGVHFEAFGGAPTRALEALRHALEGRSSETQKGAES
jgi:tRNA threonylcarbamoyl adenosine modification protein YjeE